MAKNLLEEKEKSKQSYKESNTSKKVRFAHRSEEEFSKILDFYRIKWEYEPMTSTVILMLVLLPISTFRTWIFILS
jgi:hypothetical protein